ncbi:MAG: hypothetical protein QOI66_2228 [Myxococcales bacterium]|jgi:hypothetical protein|nr:hypothetical protein [Myxococcales bacterium]
MKMKTLSSKVLGPGLASTLMRYALVVLIGGALAGCAGQPDDSSGGAGLGQVSVSLSVVPADILCLRVSGEGADRTVVRDIDIPSAQPITATLTGIPLGPVTFTAQAYAAACGAVTASTVADWVSDPTTVSVALSHIATVDLTMHRNGRAKVTIEFPDEAICSPAGAACTTATTCCSHACSKGACKDVPDAGSDDAS